MINYKFTNKVTGISFTVEGLSNVEARKNLHALFLSIGMEQNEAITAQKLYRGQRVKV